MREIDLDRPAVPVVDPRLHALRTLAEFLVRHAGAPAEPPDQSAIRVAPALSEPEVGAARRAA